MTDQLLNPDLPPDPPIPAKARAAAATECAKASATDRQRSMNWAQRLKRVCGIGVESCRQCGGCLRIIASIEAPAVVN